MVVLILVCEVYRGNNKLDCEEVQSDAKRRKYTKCLVKDQADVNTRFLVKILPNSAKPEDVNRLEIRLFYVKRFWLMKVNYLESHTVKSG